MHARPRRRRILWRTGAAALVVAMAATFTACSLSQVAAGGYTITADFSEAIGVYSDSPVKVLGVSAGAVTHVDPIGDHVRVTMRIDKSTKLPRNVGAQLVPVSAIGQIYVRLTPAYIGGPTFPHGGHIPLRRTSTQTLLDDLLRGVGKLTGSIDKRVVTTVVKRLATLLHGQGRDFNTLLRRGANVAQLLGDRSNDLGDIVDAASQLTDTLQARDTDIAKLITNFQKVVSTLAGARDSINATITNFDDATAQVLDLMRRYNGDLGDSLAQATRLGRTLDRNFSTLDTTFEQTDKLFTVFGRLYYPPLHAIQTSFAQPLSELLGSTAYYLRDRLAGICERLYEKNPVPGSPLDQCRNPSSPTNPLNPLIPSLIDLLRQGGFGGSPPISPNASAPNTTAAPASPGATAAPQAQTSTPAQPQPSATPSAQAALDAATRQILEQIFASLDPKQVDVLKNFNPTLLQLITGLSPAQLARLAHVTPAQLAEVAKIRDPAKAAAALNKVLDSITPQQLLEPLLGQHGLVRGLTGDGS